ncbi:MAG: acetyl/propionyl/methylcrotonyl-CoA carboxylase subunit alpha [Stappiaceae bacterium]
MIKKLLVANRGEIACRIIRTARSLGIKTVAIYSDADQTALHVSMADEAYRVGSPPVSESYLMADRIVEIGVLSKADAIHPGYGFLSENPEFVEKVEAAGLIFVGPPAEAIRSMGLKDAAKKLMEQAGVPVVPGYHGSERDPDSLAKEADRIGYPVLIKARAGGGGKGMRRVDGSEDFRSALEGAQREGMASFGDSVCLIEKYLTKPRHIEIQVFGDAHGNVVHLFERDCSLQRRHQKVIEEAPAPDMPQDMREEMGRAAVQAARAIGYQGAGTIEFIADVTDGLRPDRFYFMEMNTRLQVEHPVTELVTGQDLVEWQLRVASGEALPVSQEDLGLSGWAFEARLYAEDVAKNFLPATGTLNYLDLPEDRARIDSGVRQGDTITPYYDPMIAKIIVHGQSRQAALNKLQTALENSHVAGTTTNIAFLSSLARHPDFESGDVDTGLIDRNVEALVVEDKPNADVIAIAALASAGRLEVRKGTDPFDTLSGWRHWTEAKQFVRLEWQGDTRELCIVSKGAQEFSVEIENEAVSISVLSVSTNSVNLSLSGRKTSACVVRSDRELTVFFDGRSCLFNLPDLLDNAGDVAEGGENQLIAPMPGLVKLLHVSNGETVIKGAPLLVLEAMKMEHTLLAPRDGAIGEIMVSEGGQVSEGTMLLVMAEEKDAA